MQWVFLCSLFLEASAHAEFSRCERIRAEAIAVRSLPASACDESREVHDAYLKAIPELEALCRKIETEMNQGAPRLKLGTEEEMHREIVEIRQRHLIEQRSINDRITRELLPTPLDNNDSTRIFPKVSSECGTEIEDHVRFRRTVLRYVNEFYRKLEGLDDTLFQQAAERALPPPQRKPAESTLR